LFAPPAPFAFANNPSSKFTAVIVFGPKDNDTKEGAKKCTFTFSDLEKALSYISIKHLFNPRVAAHPLFLFSLSLFIKK